MYEGIAETTVETPAATATVDRSELISKVAGNLEKVFGESADEPAPVADDPADSSAATEDDEPTEEAQDEPTEEGKVEQEVKGAAAEPKEGDAPTLPAAYRRSLLATEWTDEEIDHAVASGGQSFLATAAKIHAIRTTEVQRWADEGRRRREEQSKETTDQQPKSFEPLKPLDKAKLEEEFGKDAMIERIVAPVNAVIETLNAIFPRVAAYEANTQKAETEALGRQVEEFFGSKELEPYQEFYGGGKIELNDERIKNRNEVLINADDLIGGAEKNGRKLSLGQALSLAHDAVAGKFKEKAAVTKVRQTLQKRGKGITLKPGNRKPALGASDPNKPKSRAELEKTVASKLKAVFA